jgi:hypothetical protein
LPAVIVSGCALARLRFAVSGCALARLRFAVSGCALARLRFADRRYSSKRAGYWKYNTLKHAALLI